MEQCLLFSRDTMSRRREWQKELLNINNLCTNEKVFHSLFPASTWQWMQELTAQSQSGNVPGTNHSHALLLRADTSSVDLRKLLRLNDQKCNYFRSLFMLQLVCLNLKLLTRVSRFSFNWFYCNMHEWKKSLQLNWKLYTWPCLKGHWNVLEIGFAISSKHLEFNLRIHVMFWELFLLPVILWIINYSQQNNSNRTLDKLLRPFSFSFRSTQTRLKTSLHNFWRATLLKLSFWMIAHLQKYRKKRN